MPKVRMLSISQYVQTALDDAVYEPDEHGVIVAYVPGAQGFFLPGSYHEPTACLYRQAHHSG